MSRPVNFWGSWELQNIDSDGNIVEELFEPSPSRRSRLRSPVKSVATRIVHKKLVSKKGCGEIKIGDTCLVSGKGGFVGMVLIADIQIHFLDRVIHVVGCTLENFETLKLPSDESSLRNELFLTSRFNTLNSEFKYTFKKLMSKVEYQRDQEKYDSENSVDELEYYFTEFATDIDKGQYFKYDIYEFIDFCKAKSSDGEIVVLKEIYDRIFKQGMDYSKRHAETKASFLKLLSNVKLEPDLQEPYTHKNVNEEESGNKANNPQTDDLKMGEKVIKAPIAHENDDAIKSEVDEDEDQVVSEFSEPTDVSEEEEEEEEGFDEDSLYSDEEPAVKKLPAIKKLAQTPELSHSSIPPKQKRTRISRPRSVTGVPKLKLTDAIKKYSKKHVGRSKKSHLSFAQRFSNIKDIPDLSNIANFHQCKMRETRASLNQRFVSPRKKKQKSGSEEGADEGDTEYGVETIYSKLKNTLVSSYLDNKQKQEKIREMAYQDEEGIPGREDEYSRLFLSIYSSLESEEGTSIYVSGTPGVGKTLTIRQVIKDLYEPSLLGDLPLFQYIEMNGLKFISSNDCYEVLWQNISGEHLTSSAALQSLEYYFQDIPKDKKRCTIVLLDEMDTLVNSKDQDVMYNFFNWPTYKNSKLIVIAVGNTMDLPEKCLSNKISSRLGLTRVQFTGYTHLQLQKIIKLRLKYINNCWFYVNLKTGKAILSTKKVDLTKNGEEEQYKKIKLTINDNAIEIVSRKIASVSGDARTALKICSRGIEIAEQEYLTQHGYDIYSLAKKDGSTAASGPAAESQPGQDSLCMEEEVYEIEIKHVLKATQESNNYPITQYINNLSFGGKLILYAYVSLRERNSMEEQSFGDILDEIRNIIYMNTDTSSKYIKDIKKLLYVMDGDDNNAKRGGGGAFENEKNDRPELRIIDLEYLINELLDSNILVRNNYLNERNQMYRLNMSFEELKKNLKIF